MAHKILLTATVSWPSAARYASGFVTAGCEVDALAPANAPAHASRYVAQRFKYNPFFPLSSLRKAIAKSQPELVVACDDRAVSQLLRLHRSAKAHGQTEIAALIERSLGVPENYARVLSRYESLSALRAAGVRVPDTLAVPNEKSLEECLSVVGFPAVLKSDGSWGGDGVVIVHNREDALAAFRRLARPPSRLRSLVRAFRRRDAHYLLAALAPSASLVSVQRFIAGRPAASAFAAQKGEIKGALYYDMLITQGVTGPPSVIRRVDCPEMIEATRRVAECFGLSGLHGLDFIRDASGAVHLIEINPRTTQGGTLAFGPGRDLPAALAATLSSGPIGMRETIDNDTVVFFPREWQRDPESPYLKSGFHDVPWDDPAIVQSMLGAPVRKKKNAAPAASIARPLKAPSIEPAE